MRYIQYTNVNGDATVYPEIPGLVFVWARESRYPTNAPDFFGSVPDEADISVDGVVREWSEADFETMRGDEMEARKAPFRARIDELYLRRVRPLAEGNTDEVEAIDKQIADLKEQLDG